VGLARAARTRSDILLFDEPTAGLDLITCGEIESLIADLKAKRHAGRGRDARPALVCMRSPTERPSCTMVASRSTAPRRFGAQHGRPMQFLERGRSHVAHLRLGLLSSSVCCSWPPVSF
jgi:hypothetical protein